MTTKVALVTGGARGIARGVALDLAARGWSVAICYRTSAKEANEVIDAVKAQGVRGSALRDATTFIQFNDFSNQFEFAAVSNALHERVLREVVGRLDLEALVGKRITAIGAATLQAGAPADAAIDLVPIELRAEGGTR